MNATLPLRRHEPDCIEATLHKLDSDPSAMFEKPVLNALTTLRQRDPAGYQRVRGSVKGKVCVGELDRLTVPKSDRGESDPFPEVAPWPIAVDGAVLLSDLCKIIAAHVAADPPTICAAALWIVHTYCMDVLTVSPLAHISSPEMRCGKTVLLTAMMRLVYRPLSVASISTAAIFRTVEKWAPTLGVDEVDAYLRDNQEARGLINSGLYRENARVIRCEGDDHTPRPFSTWAPKILCGIGKLAGTIEDRSIPLRMRRKMSGEVAASIRRSDRERWDALRSQLARWTDDHRQHIGQARPAPAVGLSDRAQDCWEPLLAIADEAGGEWPRRARAAALALHGAEEEAPSIGVELLRDIEAAFKERGATRLASRDLLEILTGDDEAPWATWSRGKPMSALQLAVKLSEFGVKPKPLRINGGAPVKGYELEAFKDAFSRYLLDDGGNSSVTRLQPLSHAGSQGLSSVTGAEGVTDRHAAQTAPQGQCNDVTDQDLAMGKLSEGGMEIEAFDL